MAGIHIGSFYGTAAGKGTGNHLIRTLTGFIAGGLIRIPDDESVVTGSAISYKDSVLERAVAKQVLRMPCATRASRDCYRGDGDMTCSDLCDRAPVAYAYPPSSIWSYSSQAVRAS